MSSNTSVAMTSNYMSDSITQIAVALCALQGEMEDAKKDAENTFYSKRYSSLSAVRAAAREPLKKNGLSVTQLTREIPRQVMDSGEVIPERIVLDTLLVHISGEWFKSVFPLPVPIGGKHGPTPQDWGGLLSYFRRYQYQSILGIATADDDDANGASGITMPGNAAQLSNQAPQAKVGASRPQQAQAGSKSQDNQGNSGNQGQRNGPPPPAVQLATFRNRVATTNLQDPTAVERARAFITSRITDEATRKEANAYLDEQVRMATEQKAAA